MCAVPQTIAALLGSAAAASGSPKLLKEKSSFPARPHPPGEGSTAFAQPRRVAMARHWHRDTLRPRVPAQGAVMGWLKALWVLLLLGSPLFNSVL